MFTYNSSNLTPTAKTESEKKEDKEKRERKGSRKRDAMKISDLKSEPRRPGATENLEKGVN